jgi:predicted secreted hydrolase
VLSLRIFDRSFAVTYYLQAVAIAIGLVGIAASLSAQVLARRKEFGLLSHLGLTRGQVVPWWPAKARPGWRPARWSGWLLGLAVSMVLVFVVNPQSFHWTMDLVLPWGRLLRAVRGGAGRRHRHGGLRRAPPRRARGGAVGEGGLVRPAPRACLLRLAAAFGRRRGPRRRSLQAGRARPAARRRSTPCAAAARWCSRATTARTWVRARVVVRHRLAGQAEAAPTGFQVTFFRSRTGPGRRQPQPLRAAPVAVRARRRDRPGRAGATCTPAHRALVGRRGRGPGRAATDDGTCAWRLADASAGGARPGWRADRRRGLPLDLTLRRTQPLLLQGDAGFSRKGPDERRPATTTASRSCGAAARCAGRPHAACQRPRLAGPRMERRDPAPEAVGWDWIGINLLDGGALTAFQLRRADGSALWAGGSWRPPAAAHAPSTPRVRFMPGRTGPARPPAALPGAVGSGHPGRPLRRARAARRAGTRQPRSTGTVYWEGLSELLDDAGRRVGLGYLEMTGYATRGENRRSRRSPAPACGRSADRAPTRVRFAPKGVHA